MNEIIQKDEAFLQEMHNFTKQAFGDGMVPESFEGFKLCLNNETTDGSPCFAYNFGKGENQTAMLFYYPFHCAVPARYQKNLRRGSFNRISLLNLDYQQMMAKMVNNIEYLTQLLYYMEDSLEHVRFSTEMHLSGVFSYSKERTSEEWLSDAGVYKQKYDEIVAEINAKIAELSRQGGDVFE